MRVSRLVVALLLVAGCAGAEEADESPETGSGAATADEAVIDLVTHLATPDFAAASALALPNQAALASLAEGATFGEIAAALTDGDSAVAANFWSGFAQGAGSHLVGPITTETLPVITQGDIEFHPVKVMLETGETRQMLTRETDGYRIDLFASFGAGLADKMISPVERLLAAQTDDSRLILSELQETVPSLLVAAAQPDLPPAIVQELLQLVELITRLG